MSRILQKPLSWWEGGTWSEEETTVIRIQILKFLTEYLHFGHGHTPDGWVMFNELIVHARRPAVTRFMLQVISVTHMSGLGGGLRCPRASIPVDLDSAGSRLIRDPAALSWDPAPKVGDSVEFSSAMSLLVITYHDSYKYAFKTFPFQHVAAVVFLVIESMWRCSQTRCRSYLYWSTIVTFLDSIFYEFRDSARLSE